MVFQEESLKGKQKAAPGAALFIGAGHDVSTGPRPLRKRPREK